MKSTTTEKLILSALKRRNRVTRKTAIENGWCENLTATISRLRRKGFSIKSVRETTPEGDVYTRYSLLRQAA
jgi:hypothetical protein